MSTTATMDSSTQTPDQPEFDRFTSPRAEIDTSAPFGSVEEAVIRFGGRGFWLPGRLIPSPSSDESDSEEIDVYKLDEQAAEMLKDLDTKQQETLTILNELKLTKTLVEELKLELRNEASGSVMLDLNQAKQNLSQSTNGLEAIRASIEHANKAKKSLKRAEERQPRKLGISRELRELNHEAEQFMKTAEAAKAEVLQAMSDIEQAKAGLRVIEMRWVAARKMKEAARAAEALALAEIRALSMNGSLSESIEIANGRDHAAEETLRRSEPVSRPAASSMGDILSRKLPLSSFEGEGQRVTLDQMLNRHRIGTLPRTRSSKNSAGGGGGGGDLKGFFSKRKPFGFVNISLPLSKQSKSRIQAMNLW